MWTTNEAIAMCRLIEAICPAFGCHVALTGGTLYKDGPRKDLDLVFYRIRQRPIPDIIGMFDALRSVGIECETVDYFRWRVQATHAGRKIDCFFPEADGGEYDSDDEPDTRTAIERSIDAEAERADVEYDRRVDDNLT